MHVLIIPSERYVPVDDPLAGIFQRDQALALRRSGEYVGILSVELRSLTLLKKSCIGWPSGQTTGSHDDIQVYRHHGWFWTPLLRSYYLRQYLREGCRLFKRYVSEQGLPDLIHAHNAQRGGILAAEIKRKYGVPFVITEHSSAYSREAIRKGDVECLRQAYANADRVLVVSRSLGAVLENYFGGTFGVWQVMPNILDNTFVQNPITGAAKDANRTIFLNVGGLNDVKQQDVLIAAFAQMYRGQDAVTLKIVGGGTLLKKLEMIARESGVANQVLFTGQLDRPGVLKEMQNCDVYVHSSSSETFGVAIIEAMACGKPVVSTACGGPDDIVTADVGTLVEVGDTTALANAMDFVLTHIESYDAEKIREICLERYGEKAVCNSLLTVYREVLQQTRRN